jgi:acetyl-CoA acyltransferase
LIEAVIVDAIRSPIGKGKPGGGLSEIHPTDLLATLLQSLVARSAIDPSTIDDVIAGCVSQGGEQAGNPARQAALSAGLPVSVPGVTIDRRCGSSQQALHFAAHGIMAGAQDIVIAAGVESMSRVPMGSARMGKDISGPGVARRFDPGLLDQGHAAELFAARRGIGRERQDVLAASSHARAAATRRAGWFDKEVVPIASAASVLAADETIRESTTVEGLAALKTSFDSDAVLARFPEISWTITAGNASQIADGAAALLIMNRERAEALGLRPRARLVAFDVIGVNPITMFDGPIESTRRVLARAGMTIAQIDHFEVNEAFASVPLAWLDELGADPAKLNPCGGAIALGHPLGASGARLMVTMLHALERSGGRFGLQAICENGGMANATIIERL